MTEQSFTVAQAADPQTPGQVLADIAALRPDLRATVAANPSTYPALLDWLGSLGEPTVDAALRARGSDARAAAAYPPPTQQGYPASSAGHPGQGADPGYAGTPSYGVAAPYGGGHGGAGGPSYGYQPAGTPPGGGSKKALWIVLGIVGFLILLGVIGVFVVRGLLESTFSDAGVGSDASLDALYDRCANEDWAACDELYEHSPIGSEYEEFADTCGNRTDGGTYCVDEFGTGAGAAPDAETTESSAAETYGTDPELDALWDACEAGDDAACDDLWMESSIGSGYEEFAETCGGRGMPEGRIECST